MKKTNHKLRRFRYYWSKVDGAVWSGVLAGLIWVWGQVGALEAEQQGG